MTLLDTHVLIWLTSGDRRLGPQAREAIEESLGDGDAAVSSVSFWEIGMQLRKRRLDIRLDPLLWRRSLLDQGLIEIPVDGGISFRATQLTDFHGDPADRLIVATALQGHRLVTADKRLVEWSGRLNRLDARW